MSSSSKCPQSQSNKRDEQSQVVTPTYTSFDGCHLLISLHVLRTILRPHTLASTTWTAAIVITELLRHMERIRRTGHLQQMQLLREMAPSMNGVHRTDELHLTNSASGRNLPPSVTVTP
jgi:hypothetical protein